MRSRGRSGGRARGGTGFGVLGWKKVGSSLFWEKLEAVVAVDLGVANFDRGIGGFFLLLLEEEDGSRERILGWGTVTDRVVVC